MSRRLPALVLVLLVAGAFLPVVPAHAASAPASHHRATPPLVRSQASAGQRAQPASGGPSGRIPCDVYNAYSATPGTNDDGTGYTIAIVDASGSSSVSSDYSTFASTFGLPTSQLTVVQPFGVDQSQPDVSAWGPEVSLDVEWAHAMAPNANIVLVVARTSFDVDLIGAIDYAVNHVAADVVSMSWYFDESFYGYDPTTIQNWDSHFPKVNGAGRPVAFAAALKDQSPQVPVWPAVSANVIGVGGTTVDDSAFGQPLNPAHTTCPSNPAGAGVTQSNEHSWSGASGGASAYEPRPSYQTSSLGPKRVTPDVAMLADPNVDPVALYAGGAWIGNTAGTSVGTPIWAALVARLGQYTRTSLAGVGWLYKASTATQPGPGFNDVQPAGYDTNTGLGTPRYSNLRAQVTPSEPPPPIRWFTSYFPWYDRISDFLIRDDNIHVVNPNPGDVVVDVQIPGQPGCDSGLQILHPYPAPEFIFKCDTGFGGPVTVSATGRVLATQRVRYGQTFNEMRALPMSSAAISTVFTWYDHASSPGFKSGSDDIHVVNPGATATANVTVNIPGCGSQGFALPAGQDHPFSCANGVGGPVTVTSDQPVLASQRVKYFGSFNEVPGISAAGGNYSLWLSWFDRISDPGFQSDNVHVWAPQTARIQVTIPRCGPAPQVQTTKGAGEVIFSCPGGFGGPVHVVADDNTTAANPVNVVATQRVQYYQTFNEVPAQSIDEDGAPLWITWYDLRSDPGFTSDDIHLINPGSTDVNYTVSVPGCQDASGTVTAGSDVYPPVSCPGGIGGPVKVTARGGPLLAAARVKYYASFNEVTAST